jgi:hypothetical protein
MMSLAFPHSNHMPLERPPLSLPRNTSHHTITTPFHARRSGLEPFDEEEEFDLKCNHYAIVTATVGDKMMVGRVDGLIHLNAAVPSTAPAAPAAASTTKGGASTPMVDILRSTLHHVVHSDAACSGATDEDDDSPTILTNHLERRRWSHAAAVVGSSLYMYGGFGGAKTARMTDLTVLDLSTMGWVDPSPALSSGTGAGAAIEPTPRVSPAMCGISSEQLLLFGGREGPMRPKADCHLYDPLARQWRQLEQAGTIPSARWRHTLTEWLPGHAVLVGGRDAAGVCIGDGNCCFDVCIEEDGDVGSDDVRVDSASADDDGCGGGGDGSGGVVWKPLVVDGPAPSPRYGHAAARMEDGVVVVSGGMGALRAKVTPLHLLIPPHDAICGGGRGGGGGGGKCSAHGATRLTPAVVARWEAPSFTPTLPCRYSHGCVAQGHLVLLVGGVGDTALLWGEQFVLVDIERSSWCYVQASGGDGLHSEMLLIRHCTVAYEDRVLVCGGGASCFGFGALFNPWCTEFGWNLHQ